MTLEEQLAAEAASNANAEAKKAQYTARGKEIAEMLKVSVSESRQETLAIAEGLGADLPTLRRLAAANRVSRNSRTIKLPKGRFAHLSRGRAWCRSLGAGSVFFDDHVVGPGKYAVGSSDGFSRKDREEWDVEHVQVGDRTWTIAN